MKRVLIVGSTGMLGSTVKEYFGRQGHDVHTLDRQDIDLSRCSYNELKQQLLKISPIGGVDVLINCAALIRQRKGIPTEDFIMLNSVIPHWLVGITNELGIKMIHVTTDCVYDGQHGGYQEDDSPHFNELDIYALTKSMGDVTGCTTIRTSIIGEESRNKVSLLEWVRSHENGTVINGYTNHFWNGLTSLQLAKIMEQIVREDGYWLGIKHLHSLSRVSKYELVCMINEVYSLGLTVKEHSTECSIDRTLKSNYDFQSVFKVPHLYKQLLETKEFHTNGN